MSSMSFRSSNPDAWTRPRPHSDPSLRLMKHGKIQSMDPAPGFLARLFGARLSGKNLQNEKRGGAPGGGPPLLFS
jgi:hypothetical protein